MGEGDCTGNDWAFCRLAKLWWPWKSQAGEAFACQSVNTGPVVLRVPFVGHGWRASIHIMLFGWHCHSAAWNCECAADTSGAGMAKFMEA